MYTTIHAMLTQVDQPGHVVAENRAVRLVGLAGAVDFHADGQAEHAGRVAGLFDQATFWGAMPARCLRSAANHAIAKRSTFSMVKSE